MVLGKTTEGPLDSKEIKPINPKGIQSWIFIGRTEAEAEAPILWPPDARNWLIGQTLMLGKTEGMRRRDNRGWDGWMASLTRCTTVWAISGGWWWTRKPGVLQSMESERVRHDWVTKLNWTSNPLRLNHSLNLPVKIFGSFSFVPTGTSFCLRQL